VTSHSTGKLSIIEKDVVREIRALRASPGEALNASLLANPARTAHHFILASHGNVQLRLTFRTFQEKSGFFTQQARQAVLRNSELSPDR
jgi:hypothetical protein